MTTCGPSGKAAAQHLRNGFDSRPRLFQKAQDELPIVVRASDVKRVFTALGYSSDLCLI